MITSNSTESADGSAIGGTFYILGSANDNVNFRFTGTKLRIITTIANVGTNAGISGGNKTVSIDGVEDTFSTLGDLQYKILSYEKTGLTSGVHSVTITNPTGGVCVWFDAVDIDSTGSLLEY